MLEYSRNLKAPSRELRKNMTDAERLLWSKLRVKQLLEVQFYRQKPIGPFIVDFYAHAAALVVEVDGGQHYETEHAGKDAERDKCLVEAGLLVMRFDNLQVSQETDAVVEEIQAVVRERLNPPRPPFAKGGNSEKGNGGDMKKTMFLLFVLCLVTPRIALGIPCEKIESALLKDMDKETLAMTYCNYKSRSDANQETIRTFEDFSFMEDAQACMDEMLKVERIYKNRFAEEPPACGQ